MSFHGYQPLTLDMLNRSPGPHHTREFRDEAVEQGRNWENKTRKVAERKEKRLELQRQHIISNQSTCSLCEYKFTVKPNMQERQDLIHLCSSCYKKITDFVE